MNISYYEFFINAFSKIPLYVYITFLVAIGGVIFLKGKK